MAIKKIDPSARFKLICEFDDAVVSETAEELAAMKEGEPTRYARYLDQLDESILKFAEGAKPSRFVFRCLTNQEMGELQERHFDYDVKEKKQKFKGSKTAYFAELFRVGVVAMEDEDGTSAPVGPDEVPIAVMIAVGSAINTYTSLGKHLKK